MTTDYILLSVCTVLLGIFACIVYLNVRETLNARKYATVAVPNGMYEHTKKGFQIKVLDSDDYRCLIWVEGGSSMGVIVSKAFIVKNFKRLGA